MSKEVLSPYEALYPVPVVLVTSGGRGSRENIITIAWTGVVCSNPPSISISVKPSRYSYHIIRQAGEFAVNIPSEDYMRQIDFCGVVSGRTVDKFKETGFTAVAASKISSPIIKECPVNIECSVKDVIELGVHHMFIARVEAVNADKSVLSRDNGVDYSKARPVTYNQGEYWSLGRKLGDYGMSVKKL